MARAKKNTYKSLRDDPSGKIIAVPHYVLNSLAYKSLSGNAVRLFIDLFMQYNRANNGKLIASINFMEKHRGWTSSTTLNRAIKELIDKGLIAKTVQGHMPNKASWYAICCFALNDIPDLDITPREFPRGQYAHWKPLSHPLSQPIANPKVVNAKL